VALSLLVKSDRNLPISEFEEEEEEKEEGSYATGLMVMAGKVVEEEVEVGWGCRGGGCCGGGGTAAAASGRLGDCVRVVVVVAVVRA